MDTSKRRPRDVFAICGYVIWLHRITVALGAIKKLVWPYMKAMYMICPSPKSSRSTSLTNEHVY